MNHFNITKTDRVKFIKTRSSNYNVYSGTFEFREVHIGPSDDDYAVFAFFEHRTRGLNRSKTSVRLDEILSITSEPRS